LCAYDEGPWRPIAVRVADEVVGFVMWVSTRPMAAIGSVDRSSTVAISDADTAAPQFLKLLERADLAGHRDAASYDPQ
jgi:hypothetical protein